MHRIVRMILTTRVVECKQNFPSDLDILGPITVSKNRCANQSQVCVPAIWFHHQTTSVRERRDAARISLPARSRAASFGGCAGGDQSENACLSVRRQTGPSGNNPGKIGVC
jgi:hypothetical protein